MNGIVEQIKKIPKFYHCEGCTQEQIDEAERALNLKFPKEFADYVREFGAICFQGTEWTGLNVQGYLNVVESTKKEQQLNLNFPTNCFVLENTGIDGIIVIANSKGQIFALQDGSMEFLSNSLSDYLEKCLALYK